MSKKKQSRKPLTLATAGIILLGLTYAFWPQPTLVDMGLVTRGHIMLTIDEEAKTRVKESYVVSAPVAGRLLRTEAKPNDVVVAGETVVARMLPFVPPTLDARQRQQAAAAVDSAIANVGMARANERSAAADAALAEANLQRAIARNELGTLSDAALDLARRESTSGAALLETAAAAVRARDAELLNAQANVLDLSELVSPADSSLSILAPASGRVLRVIQESEVSLAQGEAILEVGDVTGDLEIVVELLSSDAVQVKEGSRVIIRNWGGTTDLEGEVTRIEAFGYTKFSALGVEEQRVRAVVGFGNQLSADNASENLGHGFRVEVQIITWEDEDALLVPASALFRHNQQWSAFVVEGNSIALRAVEVTRNNGIDAAVASGLVEGDRVVLYPPSDLDAGARVASRLSGGGNE